MDKRRVLHVDMDAFFAAVEELRHPELRGMPVVIGGSGDPLKRGVVSTANYEARKYGIRSAMPLKTAHRLCPHAVFLPVDYDEYSRFSEVIKRILRRYTAVVEDAGIDEAYLDISQNPLGSEEIGRRIKDDIRKETSLTCSIGIGPNKLVSKIASDLQKPDGLVVVEERDVLPLLDPLPARKLYGVGPKTEARLKRAGIHSVTDLRSVPPEVLVEWFGEVYGRYLYRICRGIDESPLVIAWQRKSLGREVTFQQDLGTWQEISENLSAITKMVVRNLKEEGLKGKTVTVKLRYPNFTTLTRSHTLPEPVNSEEEILKAAFHALSRFYWKSGKVRLIGVRIERLAS